MVWLTFILLWYSTPTDQIIRTAPQAAVSILSSQGVRQDDPLGPLLFSIGIRDLLDGLIAILGEDHLLLAYLEDVFILGPDFGILDRVLQHLDGRSSPISLKRSNSKVISFEDILNSGRPT